MSSFVGVTGHFILGLHVLETSRVAHWGSDFINAMRILLQILKLQAILCQLLPIVMIEAFSILGYKSYDNDSNENEESEDIQKIYNKC